MGQPGAGYDETRSKGGVWAGEAWTAARHLGGALLRSRLLLVYVIFGVAWSATGGVTSLGRALFNYVILLPLYVLVIYLWTRGEPTLVKAAEGAVAADRAAARRRDLALVAVLYAVNIAGVVWFWVAGPPQAVIAPVATALRQVGWDRDLAATIVNALGSVSLSLVPALLVVFGLFRFSPRQVGLAPRRLGLGLALVGIGIGLAVLIRLVFGQSTRLVSAPEVLPLALAIFCAQMFVNGLPEEFIFRGAMLSRLLPWLPNPHHALVIISVLFVASHIPSAVAQSTGAAWWTLIPLSPGTQPTGLVWGYLFYRTRSIWPGVLWHTSFVTLGVLFL